MLKPGNKSQDPNQGRVDEDKIIKVVKDYLKTSAFTDRKLTDTPTDANQVVPRKFVTLHGATANRPTGSIYGQYYFDDTLGYPIWYSSVASTWVKYDGTNA